MHHGALARVTEIASRTLLFNLAALFWITLLPFGAKNAAEHPLDPLGASMIAASCGAYLLSLAAARLSSHSTIDDLPELRPWQLRRIRLMSVVVSLDFACAALSWSNPWFGYAASLGTVMFWLIMPAPPDVERKHLEQAATVEEVAPEAAG